jgi:hypothetical protein
LIGDGLESLESDARNANIGAATAAVDYRPGSEDLGSGSAYSFDYLFGAAPGGDDIFDDDGFLAGQDFKTAAERHRIRCGIAFGEQRARSEGARDLMTNNNSPYGGSYYYIDCRTVKERLDFFAQRAA